MRLTNSWGDLRGIAFDDDEDDTAGNESTHTHGTNEKVIDTTKRDPLTGSLHYTEKAKLMQLLDQWEEPESRDDRSKVSGKYTLKKNGICT